MSCSKQPYRTQWMALCAMRAIVLKCQGQNVKVPTGAYLLQGAPLLASDVQVTNSDPALGQETSHALMGVPTRR